jgi:hypothetical protein
VKNVVTAARDNKPSRRQLCADFRAREARFWIESPKLSAELGKRHTVAGRMIQRAKKSG